MKNKNIEQQLADKIGNRSITPTEQAWGRIAHNREQAKKRKRRILRYYAAASVACLFAIASIYFNIAENGTVLSPQVVTTEDVNTDAGAVKPVIPAPASSMPPQQTVVFQEKAIATVTEDNYQKEVKPAKLPSIDIDMPKGGQRLSSTALPEVKTYTKDELYDVQATLLLNHATKEIAADKYLTTPTSDTALLKEVETEMDAYYRERAMDIFSFKHKIIRIAVKDKQ